MARHCAAAAKLLKEREASLAGQVVLLFQPAEEGGAGAKLMVDEGALQGVSAVHGLHVWPSLPSGTIASKVCHLDVPYTAIACRSARFCYQRSDRPACSRLQQRWRMYAEAPPSHAFCPSTLALHGCNFQLLVPVLLYIYARTTTANLPVACTADRANANTA